MTPRILIIEDSFDVASLLERGLSEEGFEVTLAHSGEIALRKVDDGWDLIILDLGLPDLPGGDILKYLSHRKSPPPVLILTASGDLETKVQLFRTGCDDYLTKPFAFEELLERARALLRRPRRNISEECRYEDMELFPDTLELSVGTEKVSLTPKEFAICKLLMSEPGRLVSREEMLHSVWGLSQEPPTNFIQVHFANLRKKLASHHRAEWLQTIRNSGFTFSRPEEARH